MVGFAVVLATSTAAHPLDIALEDYDDQDIFTNLSGDWGVWAVEPGSFSWWFDTTNHHGADGACLSLDYAVPVGNYGGLWNSLLGKVGYTNQYLDFTDLYGGLENSAGNPSNIETVLVTKFSFWAKGNGIGEFDHVVSVELKDIYGGIAVKEVSIPNTSDWTQYDFLVSEMSGVDLSHMKELVFVLSDYRNDYRSSHLYLDDLSLSTSEPVYDARQWSDDQFLDLLSHRAFMYFLTFTDTLRFALDRSTFSDLVGVGAIGFQLASYCIGHERGWASGLEARVETILENLSSLPMGPEEGTVNSGYRGFFYHFLESNSGTRKDSTVELSLYDTMLLIYGVLTCKEYFSDNAHIQSLAQALCDSVQWNWMVDTAPSPNQYQFWLGWKPEPGTGFNGHVDGYTDEALLVDVLALGSSTYPTTMATFRARSCTLGVYPPESPDSIAAAWTGSLFNYTFASCWLDIRYRGTTRDSADAVDIWENNRRAVIANRQFCIDRADEAIGDGDNCYTTYGDSSWGLTACDNMLYDVTGPDTILSEYYAFGALPTEQNLRFPAVNAPHLGTIATYGAGSAIAYAPDEAIAALRHYYTVPGLWSPLLGLGDAYSLDPHYFELDPESREPVRDENDNLIIHPSLWMNGPWINNMVMGIDQGPLLLALENHRSGMIWDLTNQNPNITAGLDSIFGACVGIEGQEVDSTSKTMWLSRGHPNPFTSQAVIEYHLHEPSKVALGIYNTSGQRVRNLIRTSKAAGTWSATWDGRDDLRHKVAPGVYLYRLGAGRHSRTGKLVYLK
jgi:hypothetical protein